MVLDFSRWHAAIIKKPGSQFVLSSSKQEQRNKSLCTNYFKGYCSWLVAMVKVNWVVVDLLLVVVK